MLVVSLLVVCTCTRTCVRFSARIMRSLVHRVLGVSTRNADSCSPEFQACTEVLIFQHWDLPEPEIMLLTKKKKKDGTGARQAQMKRNVPCAFFWRSSRFFFSVLSFQISLFNPLQHSRTFGSERGVLIVKRVFIEEMVALKVSDFYHPIRLVCSIECTLNQVPHAVFFSWMTALTNSLVRSPIFLFETWFDGLSSILFIPSSVLHTVTMIHCAQVS